MNQQIVLAKFEDLAVKLQLLLRDFHEMKNKLEEKNMENEGLKSIIHSQREEIKNFQNQLKISKIVNSIAESTTDSSGLKMKINEYIKEIDKCIAHLSE